MTSYTQQEKNVRKILGLMQSSSLRPLKVYWGDQVMITHLDETVGQFTYEYFRNSTVHELLEDMGIPIRPRVGAESGKEEPVE
jgi:hypothetical protein